MTAGLDRRWRDLDRRGGRAARATACSTPAAARATSRSPRAAPGGHGHRPRLLRADARACAPQGRERATGCRATCSPCRSTTRPSTSATVGFGVRNVADLERRRSRELRRVLVPGGRLGDPRDHAAARRARARSSGSGSTASCPLLGRVLPGGSAYTYLPASVRRFPGPDELAPSSRARASASVRYRLLGGGDRRAPHGSRRSERARGDPRDAGRSTRTSRRSRSGCTPRSTTYPGLVAAVGARGARGRAASGCGRCSSSSRRARRGAAGRRGGRGRARAHGDARPRRPDRRRRVPARPGRRLVGLRRRRGRERPATTSSPARSPSSPATGDADAVAGARRRGALPRARRGDAAAPDARPGHDRSRPTSSAARSRPAKLFEAACLLGSAAPTRDLGRVRRSRSASPSRSPTTSSTARARRIETGKIAGTDLREGTPTLPLLLAARRGRGRPDARSPAGRTDDALVRVAADRRARALPRDRRSTTLGRPGRTSTATLHREELEALDPRRRQQGGMRRHGRRDLHARRRSARRSRRASGSTSRTGSRCSRATTCSASASSPTSPAGCAAAATRSSSSRTST